MRDLRFTAVVEWALGPDETFPAGRYKRGHTVRFDNGVALAATASEHVVGRWADPRGVDPEEMLVAALSSCHMLSFLHVARLAGFTVERYRAEATGVMTAIAPDRQAVTAVMLRPRVTWDGAAPDAAQLARLHEEAHGTCFIANSVRTTVTIAPET